MREDQNQFADKTTDRGMLTGMFRDRESTENAYNTLQERGYSKDDIQKTGLTKVVLTRQAFTVNRDQLT